jgi:hypothetical protein
MDDTLFVDKCKADFQKSIDIAAEFYNIHDIDINTKKSEAIALNSSENAEDAFVVMGKDRSKVFITDKEIRYLGVWFSSHPTSKRHRDRLIGIIDSTLMPLKKKRTTSSQISYIVNCILIPRLIYVGQIMTLSNQDWN